MNDWDISLSIESKIVNEQRCADYHNTDYSMVR